MPSIGAFKETGDERIQQAIDAYYLSGQIASNISDDLNISGRTARERVRFGLLNGYKPSWEHGDFDDALPDSVPRGHNVKGVSTLYDNQGNAKLTWVKTSKDKENEDGVIREMIAGLTAKLPRITPIAPPNKTNDDLLTAYPVSDHHLGMLSWEPETGGDYDLEIGEKILVGAMMSLVNAAPPSRVGLIPLLGDFLHYDSFSALTPENKNLLDSDTRYPKMVRCALRCVRQLIIYALEKHAEVRVIVEFGNHDPASMVWLMESLAAIYENEPRVSVDTSPRHYHYYQFGNCLIATHHGHGTKLQDLPLLMATDKPELWGGTEFRYWWTGHVHHDQVKDFKGCRVESFRILAPEDAWASNKGYRSGRDMKAIVLHKDFGEVARHTVNPQMLVSRNV